MHIAKDNYSHKDSSRHVAKNITHISGRLVAAGIRQPYQPPNGLDTASKMINITSGRQPGRLCKVLSALVPAAAHDNDNDRQLLLFLSN